MKAVKKRILGGADMFTDGGMAALKGGMSGLKGGMGAALSVIPGGILAGPDVTREPSPMHEVRTCPRSVRYVNATDLCLPPRVAWLHGR